MAKTPLIRPAGPADLPALLELYRICFGDSPDFTGAVFERVFPSGDALIAEDSGRPAAMVLLPRLSMRCRGGPVPFGYIYALCTAPEFRGRGYMKSLSEAAHGLCAARGDAFSALVPASRELALTYERQGYRPAFYRLHRRIKPLPGGARMRRAGPEDLPALLELYSKNMEGFCHILRDGELFHTIDALYGADGGGFFIGENGYACLCPVNGGFEIRELCPRDGEEPLLADLSATLGGPLPELRLPARKGELYGMIRLLGADGPLPEAPLFSLLFD